MGEYGSDTWGWGCRRAGYDVILSTGWHRQQQGKPRRVRSAVAGASAKKSLREAEWTREGASKREAQSQSEGRRRTRWAGDAATPFALAGREAPPPLSSTRLMPSDEVTNPARTQTGHRAFQQSRPRPTPGCQAFVTVRYARLPWDRPNVVPLSTRAGHKTDGLRSRRCRLWCSEIRCMRTLLRRAGARFLRPK